MNYKKLAIVVIAVLVLGGLFLILKHDMNDKKSVDDTKQTASQNRVIKLDIAGDKLTSGEGTIKVNQGQVITLDVSSDVADELHLHGYDKSIELEPGTRKSVTFTADKAGSFEAELHDTKTPMFVLVVQPE